MRNAAGEIETGALRKLRDQTEVESSGRVECRDTRHRAEMRTNTRDRDSEKEEKRESHSHTYRRLSVGRPRFAPGATPADPRTPEETGTQYEAGRAFNEKHRHYWRTFVGLETRPTELRQARRRQDYEKGR